MNDKYDPENPQITKEDVIKAIPDWVENEIFNKSKFNLERNNVTMIRLYIRVKVLANHIVFVIYDEEIDQPLEFDDLQDAVDYYNNWLPQYTIL
jgi:hypothetical protein